MSIVKDIIKNIISSKQKDVEIKLLDEADERLQECKYLFKLGRYDEALKVCDNALKLIQNPDLLILKGKILSKLQKYEDARLLYEKALEIRKHDLGESHPSVADILIDIGELSKIGKNYREAISNYEAALSIQNGSLGSKHPNVAKTLSKLAELYELINDLEKSLLFYKYSFDIQEFSLGYNHLEVANTLSNLGRLYAKLNRLDDSMNSYLHALDIQERIYGQQDPEILYTLSELLKIFIAKNQFNEANSLLKRIIAIKKDSPGFGKQIWDSLHKLTDDENDSIRFEAASTLISIFPLESDKQQAWNDLHKLTIDKYSNVRSVAAYGIAFVFTNVINKQQAWEDLHRLTNDEDSYVKYEVALTLSSIFPYLPDKNQAWNDLVKLTSDQNDDVRTYANHFLGRISIFHASQAESEEEYKYELKKAISFFEKASQESKWNNPSQFCLSLYRLFYTIIFREEGKNKLDNFLSEAEAAIGDSKENKFLFEAVENLAEALKEVQSLRNLDLQEMKGELNYYRKYCDHAAELLKEAAEIAPYAIATMRKGLPILDRKLKSLLEEISEKAKIACRESKSTDAENIACAVTQEVQKWEIGNQKEMAQKVEDIAYILKKKIADLPENKFILEKIEAMRHEKNLTKQYEILLFVITQIPMLKVVQEDMVIENISKMNQDLRTKLDSTSMKMEEIKISLKPGIKKEFEISSGIEILGAGSRNIITIPLQEIAYLELVEDLKRIKGKHIFKLSALPARLARKVKAYLLMNDMENLIELLN